MDEENNKWADQEKWLSAELVEQSKNQTEKYYKVIKIESLIIILLIAALVGESVYFVHVMNSYEYVYQDGSGQNNYNNDVDGDVSNVATDQIEEKR